MSFPSTRCHSQNTFPVINIANLCCCHEPQLGSAQVLRKYKTQSNESSKCMRWGHRWAWAAQTSSFDFKYGATKYHSRGYNCHSGWSQCWKAIWLHLCLRGAEWAGTFLYSATFISVSGLLTLFFAGSLGPWRYETYTLPLIKDKWKKKNTSRKLAKESSEHCEHPDHCPVSAWAWPRAQNTGTE